MKLGKSEKNKRQQEKNGRRSLAKNGQETNCTTVWTEKKPATLPVFYFVCFLQTVAFWKKIPKLY